MLPRVKRFLLGSPLRTTELHEQKLSKKAALTVFASDNLSSNAYATEEILLVLMAAPALLHYAFPISICIVALLTIVVLSYGQLIRAYPSGGGAYTVAKENLGVGAGLVAAAALLIDYILTVAVSVAAGVAAIVSAFPVLLPYRTLLGALAIAILTLVNLRGARESARAFAPPVYTFLVTIYALILVGLYRSGEASGAPPVTAPGDAPNLSQLALIFLLCRAFAHGCVALTGVEAISNGVQAFQPPVVRNAQITMYIMAVILGSLFLGLSYLATEFRILPKLDGSETVVSQIARQVFGVSVPGWGLLYYLTQFSTMAILILAANTSYAGFPRLASILAADRFVPRQLANLGDRLVFSNGIIVLGMAALALIWAFGGNVHALIPLYAIGVFLSFTLSQSGLVVHWLRSHEAGRWWRFGLNALGALTTGLVLLIIAVVKFQEGAWLVVVAVPAVMLLFWKTRRHYFELQTELTLSDFEKPRVARHTVIVPVPIHLNRVVLTAIEYAKSISRDVIAVTVNTGEAKAETLLHNWKKFVEDVPLIVLDSPYRSVARPLLRFIGEIEDLRPDDKVTVVLPEFVPKRWWHNLLHNQTSLILKGALLFRPGIVVTSVPHHLGGTRVTQGREPRHAQ
ncbi:MAG: APC family permease [Acidobacteriia bacterium]|jgi:amino acid transporter|nr:APC family permease [Terriglobia bacterium]